MLLYYGWLAAELATDLATELTSSLMLLNSVCFSIINDGSSRDAAVVVVCDRGVAFILSQDDNDNGDNPVAAVPSSSIGNR